MPTHTTTLSEKRKNVILWSLLCFMPIVGMAVDLISPSLPAISHGLNVSTQSAKNVISIYLLGYALGNLVTGFLSDAFGRQKLLRLSLFLFFLVSSLPVFFPNITLLIVSRLLQGITLGAIATLNRTIFADILSSEQLVRLGVLIGTMWGIGPIIGPIIGGYLQFYFNWQAGFIFFTALGLIGFIVITLVVPETHHNQHPLNIATIKNNIIEVFQHKKFMALVFLMGCAYSLIIIFNTIGPFFIQQTLHHTSVFFGHIAFGMGVIFLLATLSCRALLKKHSTEKIYCVCINTFFAIALIALIISFFLEKDLYVMIMTTAAMYVACGFIFPMSMGKGVSYFRHISGAASSIMYFINVLITSFASFLSGFIHAKTIIPIISMDVFLLLICFVIYWKALHTKNFISS